MHHVKIKTERQDAEAAGARSRLDSVLKGLLERSASEKEQNEGDTGKMSADSLNKDLSPSSAGKRQVSIFQLSCVCLLTISAATRVYVLFHRVSVIVFIFPDHQPDFHSTGGRSAKRWRRAYPRQINTNKVYPMQHFKTIEEEMLYNFIVELTHFPLLSFHLLDAYIIKLFDRSVDLAQFNTSTPLYPICRAWMRNNPSVRAPPASPSPPHIMVEEELTDMINGKGQNVYRLPPPTSCPISTSGEPVNLRIPQTEKPTVNKLADSLPVPGSLICDHMERWKKIRQKWKECSNKNQLRYSESIKVLKEMKELYDR
ncbi:protein lin-37 homolog isoform 2-T2 [Spinachia spinachia]